MIQYERGWAIRRLQMFRNIAAAMTGVAVVGFVGAAQDAIVTLVVCAVQAVVWGNIAIGAARRIRIMRE